MNAISMKNTYQPQSLSKVVLVSSPNLYNMRLKTIEIPVLFTFCVERDRKRESVCARPVPDESLRHQVNRHASAQLENGNENEYQHHMKCSQLLYLAISLCELLRYHHLFTFHYNSYFGICLWIFTENNRK